MAAMSADRVRAERYKQWRDHLYDAGLMPEEPPRPAATPDAIKVFARWDHELRGRPPLTVSIEELWLTGSDLGGLGTDYKGCYLHQASWHAQFQTPRILEDDRAAERFDVDRLKEPRLWMHRHPLWEINDVRQPVDRLPAPLQWLHLVLSHHIDLAED